MSENGRMWLGREGRDRKMDGRRRGAVISYISALAVGRRRETRRVKPPDYCVGGAVQCVCAGSRTC